MRITQKYTDRTYLKYNNRLLENNAASMEKIWRQKAYKRASEDPINASKAMIVRRNLRDLDVYDSNLKTADGLFKAAESNLYTLADKVYINVQNKIEQACNGTYDKEVDLQAIATELEEVADSALNLLNKDYAERTMFGGTNNSKSPFTKRLNNDGTVYHDANGSVEILYNGVSLKDITKNAAGKYVDAAGKEVPGTKPIFVDIGIGIKYDENYEVDPQTALDVSLNGAAITGFGTDTDDKGVTYNNNFVQQIFDAAAALRRGDVSYANATLDRLNEANKLILTEITTLGAKQNGIEFYLEKNDDYRTSLKDRQNDVEGVDFAQEITDWKANQAAYDAILQMSAKILPNSVFDFMR